MARARYMAERTDAAWEDWRRLQAQADEAGGVNAWGEELPAAPFDFCHLMGIIFECAMDEWESRARRDPLAMAIHKEFEAENRRWVYA